MRQVLESKININISRFPSLSFYQKVSFFQAFLNQPSARRVMENIFKIPFKCRDTSSCKVSKTFNAYIELIIAIHKFFEVYFFRMSKIKENRIQLRLLLQKDQ